MGRLQDIGQALTSAADAADSSGTAAVGTTSRHTELAAALSKCWRLPPGEARASRLEQLLAAGRGDTIISVPPVRMQLLLMSHKSSYLASADDLLPSPPPSSSSSSSASAADTSGTGAAVSLRVAAAGTGLQQLRLRQLATGQPLSISVQLVDGLGLPHSAGKITRAPGGRGCG